MQQSQLCAPLNSYVRSRISERSLHLNKANHEIVTIMTIYNKNVIVILLFNDDHIKNMHRKHFSIKFLLILYMFIVILYKTFSVKLKQSPRCVISFRDTTHFY